MADIVNPHVHNALSLLLLKAGFMYHMSGYVVYQVLRALRKLLTATESQIT